MCNITCLCFFFNDTATTEIYTLSLHDALPISDRLEREVRGHLSAEVPAHAVRDREQRLEEQVRVLVAVPDLADVGRRADRDLHRRSSSTVLPSFTTSPECTSSARSTLWSLRKVPFVDPTSSTNHEPFSP